MALALPPRAARRRRWPRAPASRAAPARSARPSTRAWPVLLEARGEAARVLHASTRPAQPATDVLVPNRRAEWIALDAPGEVELVVALLPAPPGSDEELLRAAPPPAGREAPGVDLGDGAADAPFLLVVEGGASDHRLTPLWVDDEGAGVVWRVRLHVE
ncbi:MAG: hypothetical protein KF878_37960 [Planctomycetes bacterium]|nr:hypothetical protein [Planctomycetota bacterium]